MPKVTPEKKAKFLSILAEGGSVTEAATAIGVARKKVYAWRNKDEQFTADWEDIVEQGTDSLEDEAVKRAKDYSDTLLIFLLKGRRKERYAERQEHTGKDGGPITLQQWLNQHSGKTWGRLVREGNEQESYREHITRDHSNGKSPALTFI